MGMERSETAVDQAVMAKGKLGVVRVKAGGMALVDLGDGVLRAFFFGELEDARGFTL